MNLYQSDGSVLTYTYGTYNACKASNKNLTDQREMTTFWWSVRTRMPSRGLTLADAVALEPGARGIPHKLLPVFLDGDVEGVTDIWVVEVSHTQHLRKKIVSESKTKEKRDISLLRNRLVNKRRAEFGQQKVVKVEEEEEDKERRK